ncbi:hypothetical protein [Cellulophaga lytica]|uniref:hypothetical protein n=1 Tax=Cellulophaga lytica TaxID=979 RepID=UPI003CE46E8F
MKNILLTIVYPFWFLLGKTWLGNVIILFGSIGLTPVLLLMLFPDIINTVDENIDSLGLAIGVMGLLSAPFIITLFLMIIRKLEICYKKMNYKTTTTLLTLVAFFAIANTTAQSFTLTPEGFTNAEHNYIVVETPGTQAELYKKTMIYLTGLYKNADKALSTVENEIITINGYAPNSIHRNSMHVFNMDYTLVLKFKDGKIKIEAPNILLTTYTTQKQTLHISWLKTSLTGVNLGIFGKKGKLKSKKAKADLENYFNSIVTDFKAHLNEDKTDW